MVLKEKGKYKELEERYNQLLEENEELKQLNVELKISSQVGVYQT